MWYLNIQVLMFLLVSLMWANAIFFITTNVDPSYEWGVCFTWSQQVEMFLRWLDGTQTNAYWSPYWGSAFPQSQTINTILIHSGSKVLTSVTVHFSAFSVTEMGLDLQYFVDVFIAKSQVASQLSLEPVWSRLVFLLLLIAIQGQIIDVIGQTNYNYPQECRCNLTK